LPVGPRECSLYVLLTKSARNRKDSLRAKGTVDTAPLRLEYATRLVAEANREMEEIERGFDETERGGGAVHVQSHTRENGKVEVADYWRARSGEGAGSDPAPEAPPEGSPKPRNLRDAAGDGGEETDDSSAAGNEEFLDRISKAEQSFDKPGDGYEERNPVSNELGALPDEARYAQRHRMAQPGRHVDE
jgi:hypothetical protein